MSDIFVSYSTQNRRKIAILVALFERCGWSVWWDREISPGREWEPSIEEALAAATCVVVAWSRTSVTSDWVAREARTAIRRNVLVPLLIEPVEPPQEFCHLQCTRLTAWVGAAEVDELHKLLAAIAARLGREVPEQVAESIDQVVQEMSRIDAAHAALEYSAALIASIRHHDETTMERVRQGYEGLARALAPISDDDLHDLLQRLFSELEVEPAGQSNAPTARRLPPTPGIA
jgi:hypothetical protein